MLGPGVSDMVYQQRRKQDQDEDTAHTFQGVDLHTFDIQTIFLVKAIGMFDLGAITPLSIHSLGIVCGMDGDVGDQDQIVVQVGIVGHDGPQRLLGSGDADLEPAQLDVYDADFSSVGEGYAESQGQRHGGGQIIQHFKLPAIDALVVDLYLAIMAGAEDELATNQAHLLEDLLVIQPVITHHYLCTLR